MLVEHTLSWWRCWWNILGVSGDVGGTYSEHVEMLVEHTWNILGSCHNFPYAFPKRPLI